MFITHALLIACTGGSPTPATATHSSPPTATGATGLGGDTAESCGDGCYFVDGMCQYPERIRTYPPVTDDVLDNLVSNSCGPLAIVACGNAIGIASFDWRGDGPYDAFDAATREWRATLTLTDQGSNELCDNRWFEGDPSLRSCLEELEAWVMATAEDCGPFNYAYQREYPPYCSADPDICIRDEWPR